MKIKHLRIIIRLRMTAKCNAIAFRISPFNAIAIFPICYVVDNLLHSFARDVTFGKHFEQIKQFFNLLCQLWDNLPITVRKVLTPLKDSPEQVGFRITKGV